MGHTGIYYDELETRSPEMRENALLAALPQLVAHAKNNSPAYGRILENIEPQVITQRSALAQLPVTRKSELLVLQKQHLPFGGFVTQATGELARIFVSPGPIYDPESRATDYWRFARPLYSAGFRCGDVIQNCFSYHFTPAASMVEGGAAALGCAVIPAGVGQTEMQAQTIAAVRPKGYVGTPSFLKIILEKGDELGLDLSSLKQGVVSAEPFPPSLQREFKDRGIDVYECYATADLGMIAYQTAAREGLIVEEGVLVEIVRPGTGDPVAAGEVGEVVVTSFNEAYPLIRFATGDLSAALPGVSPCGRTNMRIKGWMGRADQTTKVKGMFVHPSQIAEVLRRHPEVQKGRLVVDNENARDRMRLSCEVASDDASLAKAIVETMQSVCKLRGEVAFVKPGALPNDGKVIDDVRTYE
ncbi:MAG: phenylacetate--CoA ligase family protein [Proteobacteria bacterium]|nr:MAG: phenylacetate--CoA ligase family protein [Pseudomonadota bacterium]